MMMMHLTKDAMRDALKNTYFCVRYYNNQQQCQATTKYQKIVCCKYVRKKRSWFRKIKCQRKKENKINDACSRYGMDGSYK